MKQFDYNPFTWEPKIGEEYFGLYSGYAGIYIQAGIYNGKKDINFIPEFGAYKKRKHLKVALEIAREAIVKNIKE